MKRKSERVDENLGDARRPPAKDVGGTRGGGLGWKLREVASRDRRWRAATLSLTRQVRTRVFPTTSRPRPPGTCFHTLTFCEGGPFSMLSVEMPALESAPAAIAELEGLLSAWGYTGAWAIGPEGTASGSWTRILRGVRDVLAELSRTAANTQRASPDRPPIRDRDALLDSARAGAFGPLRFYASYRREAPLRVRGTRTTLQLALSAGGRGVGFTFTSGPLRVHAKERSAIAVELEQLRLGAVWTPVPGDGFMLAGGLPPLGLGRPRRSIAAAVAAASALERWAERTTEA